MHSKQMTACTAQFDGSCLDLTDSSLPSRAASWLMQSHSFSLWTIFAYVLIKLTMRLILRIMLGQKCSTKGDYSSRVWDPVCLAHNIVSVVAGIYSLLTWDRGPSAAATCHSLSDASSLVILLQAAHCISDFLVFFPQMIDDPVFVAHHGVLLIVSLVLPHCPGCYYVVIAFAIAELGSASIAVDAEWRKVGGESRGLKRVVVFGGSRLVNLGLLYLIWEVTPSVHEFAINDGTDGSLIFKANVPICFATSVGGSLMMLCVNGLTWWRMWLAYLKLKKKRHAQKRA